VTLPSSTCVRHPWQLPMRQPDTAGTPLASARSSSVGQLESHVALTPEREKATEATGAGAGARRGAAGPKRSLRISSSGTPASRSPAVSPSRKAAGPQR
jgi:hypothetical protein